MVAKRSRFYKAKPSFIHHIVLSLVFVAVVFGIFGFLVYQNVRLQAKRLDLTERVEVFHAQVSGFEEENQRMETEIDEIQTEEYQEKVLREKGLYRRPGEEVVTILAPEEPERKLPVEEPSARVWWNPFTW